MGLQGSLSSTRSPLNIAELMRRFTSPPTPRGRTAKASTSHPGLRSVIGDWAVCPIVHDLWDEARQRFRKGLLRRAIDNARHRPGQNFPCRYRRRDSACFVAHQSHACCEIDDVSYEEESELC